MRRRDFLLFLVGIIFFGAVLRFARYNDRWGLAYDQAHDAVIARYALETRQLPLVGPFSSAGAYQTSGVWYWFIMAATAVAPWFVITPWVVLTLLYCFMIGGMGILGAKVIHRPFGLLLAALTAVSTAQISQGINLTNQSPLALTSFGILFSLILYLSTYRKKWLFLIGFFVSLSGSIHLQGSALILIPVILFLFGEFRSLKHVGIFLLGFFLPTIPNFLFDLQHDFITIKNVIHYIQVDQYAVPLEVLGRNWRMFLSQVIPQEWALIIGGRYEMGILLLMLTPILMGIAAWKKALPKYVVIVFLSFLGMLVIVRYTRTPLFSSYYVFLHPFILFFTGFVIYRLWKLSKLFGILIFGLCIILTLQVSIQNITSGTNYSAKRALKWKAFLLETYPDESFHLYDKQYQTTDTSMVITLYLQTVGRTKENGKKLGITRLVSDLSPEEKRVFEESDRVILDLDALNDEERTVQEWVPVNPRDVYNATEYWADNK